MWCTTIRKTRQMGMMPLFGTQTGNKQCEEIVTLWNMLHLTTSPFCHNKKHVLFLLDGECIPLHTAQMPVQLFHGENQNSLGLCACYIPPCSLINRFAWLFFLLHWFSGLEESKIAQTATQGDFVKASVTTGPKTWHLSSPKVFVAWRVPAV